MSKKQEHQFPENWKNISSEEAIKHIKYLLEHYQEYDMRKFGDNGIVINEIYFYPLTISSTHGFTLKYMDINMQKVNGGTEDIYPMIQQLIDVCNVEINKRETEKAKKAKKQKVTNIVLGSISGALLVAIFSATGYMIDDIFKTIDKARARQNKIEKEVKKYEKTLPNYQEYKQTQQKIANYRDSLNRVYE